MLLYRRRPGLRIPGSGPDAAPYEHDTIAGSHTHSSPVTLSCVAPLAAMSSSSSTHHRSLKPTPLAAHLPLHPQYATPAEHAGLQPAGSIASFMPDAHAGPHQPLFSPASRKRKSASLAQLQDPMATSSSSTEPPASRASAAQSGEADRGGLPEPKAKKSRTNTPWTPAEELRLKQMRDSGNSWSEIAKTFPQRTEGSVKKHWYKDMHYAEFAEDESAALLAAIKEYDANKWKVIGQKVGKPAKACEQYAKENFPGKY